MKVGVFFHYLERGPGKVVGSLTRGLRLLGVEVVENALGEKNGCLQGVSSLMSLPEDTLVGPNIMTSPSDRPQVWQRFKRVVVPSIPVMLNYQKFPEMRDCTIHVWACGIDTERFAPKNRDKNGCLVYFKRRDEGELAAVLQELDSLKIPSRVLRYGSYNEEEFIEACHVSQFGVVLDGFESQGVAIMEMMAMNLPLYVLSYRQESEPFSTTTPYFDGTCGRTCTTMAELNLFRDSLTEFHPRDFVCNGFTIIQAAKKYLQLLDVYVGPFEA